MAAIMIVDDSAFMRLILKDMIQKSGHRLAGEAENGWTAVQTYREVDPDLVIMNIIMPDLNGIEALKKIKSIHPSAKVVMCSAMGNQYYVIESIQAGAIDFIMKPFDEARMIHAIHKALS
ncbi:response regulator [Paenibacillus validus]|uniref:Response regulator n=1 Tax=Paenibacillus validus TaxID=44253 RepID=A0A7X3CRH2_9BACL|nr:MULTISPECIES: response regulator [Paenibacillus]MED4602226.1 response regulator [Paenibacillus validus]MED4607392.1 response regulator [Paenibacillus validus]MUG70222.1 response regulator [Paenibacillus validus]